MTKCLIVSPRPYLFDALESTHALNLDYSTKPKPGYDLIVSDTNLKTKTHTIALTERPIHLPTAIQEIEAYINSLSKQLHFAGATLDIAARKLIIDTSNIPLTEIECKILAALILSPTNSIPKEEIKTSILGYRQDIQTSTIENHIYHLRQKLSDSALKIDRVGGEYKLVC